MSRSSKANKPNLPRAVPTRKSQSASRPKESVRRADRGTESLPNEYAWIFLGLILLFVVIVRARLLGIPLERDEGEYAYLGQLIQQGIPPYSIAYNMKFPGTYFMYALIMSLFGQTITGVHLGLMVMNCSTIVLVYKICAKILNSFAGIVAACTYALLSLSSSALGFAAHATHFVVFWAMAGLLVLLHALEKNRFHLYFAAGALLALAFIMKQPGLFLTLFGAAYVGIYRWQDKSVGLKRTLLNLIMFSGGVLAAVSIVVTYLYIAGVFQKFWFFTFVYSFKYISQVPLSQALDTFISMSFSVMDGLILIWVLAGLGLICLFLHPALKGKRMAILLFAVCSFLTICPGYYFRRHYFITLLPAVSLLVGIFVDFIYAWPARTAGQRPSSFRQSLLRWISAGVFLAAASVGVANQSEYLFVDEPALVSRKIYGSNPFPESVEVARFIDRNSKVIDKIAVIGSEPQIYFYSKRHSATGHIYTYGLMEMHEYAATMQKEMAAEIERADPKFVVLVEVATSWLAGSRMVGPDSEKFIFGWAEKYIHDHCNLVGIVDIMPDDDTVYKWYDEARSYSPQSSSYLLIFQRR